MHLGTCIIISWTLLYIHAQTTSPEYGYYHPCLNHSLIISNFNRTINYTLQYGEHDECESSYLTAGWYRYELLQNIPTHPPLPGQCGSSSPIWLNGTYPTLLNENRSMLACKVGNASNCEDSWNVTVQNCVTFNVIYLEPVSSCGRYCMEPEWTYPSWHGPCFYNHTIIHGDYTRKTDYVLPQGMSEDCESSNLTAGWYRYDGFQNIPTTPPSPGQCGSSSPIWLNGSYPVMPGIMTSMTACAVSNTSSCQESWPVSVMNCYSYNVIHLNPNGNCSKYCMDSQPYQWSTPQMPTGFENCYNATVIESTDDRTVDYDLMMGEIEKCDNITEGWYRFQNNQNILNYPPTPPQCGSRAPIWLEGTYPTTYGETKTMKACMVSNYTNCENNGDVTVTNCYGYNIAYLRPFNGCGRICMENSNQWTTPQIPTSYEMCYNATLIESTYDRTFDHHLMTNEVESCDNITEGWYRFQGFQNIPTMPAAQGQCGSRSPIWLDGTYPTMYGEVKTIKACMVGNFTNCENSWNVTVVHCYGYNIAYMQPINGCGRVCMEQHNSSGTTPSTSFMNHPCNSTSVIESTYDRTFHHVLQPGDVENCDNITEGWYTFEGGKNVPTTPPVAGQCGSRSPIWFSGIYPTSFEETTTMKACMVSNFTNCEYSWNVTVMHCYGYNVAYMKEIDDCGRVCMEQQNSSGTTTSTSFMNHPCYSTLVIESTYDRTFNHILQPGDVENCDNITEGWYTFEGGQNVPTTPPVAGQCGSRSPIWFSGIYPTSFEETTTMKACMVSNFTNCEYSWNVTVMHCYGYNVAYMKEIDDCGRVCMEQQNSSGTTTSTSFMNHPCYSTLVIESTYDRTFNHILQPGDVENCDNITEGWYTFEGGQNVPTTPPVAGQCGSRSPIWFSGIYPTSFEETTTMKACMVSNFTNCEYSWNVTVMHCYGYNVAYMKEIDDCGRVCIESNDSFSETTNQHSSISPSQSFAYNASVSQENLDASYTEPYSNFQQHATTVMLDSYSGEPMLTALHSIYQPSDANYFHETVSYEKIYSEHQSLDQLSSTESWNIQPTTVSDETKSTRFPSTESTTPLDMYAQTTSPGYGYYHPCINHSVIISNSNRTINYTLQYGEHDDCESSYLTAGWYRYELLQNIPTKAPLPGQCGSSSPIWLNGTYPTYSTYPTNYAEYRTMLACQVGNSSTCEHSWNVTVLSCVTFNVIYLEPVSTCGRYCMEPEWTYTPWLGTCFDYHTIISGDYTRTTDYVLPEGMSEDCESSNLTAGWYRYDGFQNIPNTPPRPGQCGSSSPIWLNGSIPNVPGESTTMTACAVSDASTCQESWPVTVMNCYSYNLVYLEPNGNCSRYCMEQQNNSLDASSTPSWYHPCDSPSLIESTYDRTIHHVLLPGEIENCDNITEGWYRFQGGQNIQSMPPAPGQCGSRSPIWLDGTYPTSYGETTTMKACMVSNFTNCEDSWNVTVMHCYGNNIAYMQQINGCGRICMESNDSLSQTINQSSSMIPLSQSPSYDPSVSPKNLNDSYTVPYSRYQPQATPVMSDRWSQDTMYSAPNSGYQPHTTSVMSDKMSQDTMYSAPDSRYQLHSTPVMSDTWSRETMYSAPNSGYQPHATPVMSDRWSQDTIYSAPNSGYQPHATSVKSNTWSQDIMYSAPDSGYQPHATPVISDKMSQDTMYSAPDSRYQLHATPVMSDKWSQDTMFSAPDSGYQPHTTPVKSDTWSQDTMYSAPNSGYQPHATPVKSDTWSQDTMYSAPNSGYQPHATPVLSDKMSQDTMYSAPNSGYQPHATPVMSDTWNQDTIYSAPESWYPQSNTNYLYEPESSEKIYSEHQSFYQLPSTESWNIQATSVLEETISTSYLSTDSKTPLEHQSSYGTTSSSLTWTHTCDYVTMIESTFDRTIDYSLAPGEYENCDNITEGWYGFQGGQNIPTMAPQRGQCGSTGPIWLNGTYPSTFNVETIMTACMVGPLTDCESSWYVNVMHCHGYNIAYLTPIVGCGRICMEGNNSFSETIDPSSSTTPLSDVFVHDSSISPMNSDASYTVPNQLSSTDTLHQTASSEKLYSEPESHYQSTSESWNIQPTSVLYEMMSTNAVESTTHAEHQSSYGTTSSSLTWTHTCDYVTMIESTFDRTIDYSLAPGEYENCDNITEGWYGFQGGQNIPTMAPQRGQCGSMGPIWLNGTYPSTFNEETIMKACMVGPLTDCESSWYVNVMHCHGYNIAYLTPIVGCGRICMEGNNSFSETIYPSSSITPLSDVFVHDSSMSSMNSDASYTVPNQLSGTDTLYETASSEKLYSEPESHYQSTTESWNIQPTSGLYEMMSTSAVESTTPADDIVLSDFLSLSVDSSVPTFNPTSTDRQLMFKCNYWEYQYGSPILNDLLLDVKWEVNDVLFVVKYNLTLSQMQTEGRITRTDLTNAGIIMGFNVKCGMRLSASRNSTYLESYPRYAGMEVWPKHFSLSSGESAKIYVWTTVPVACMYDSSSACDLTLEMNNFNEEFTSGAPMSCNQSITKLTKPSLCGLVLDGWKTSSWQKLDIKLPENTAQDQEYTAKVQLRVAFSLYDTFWVNYVLPEITISVINENVTDSYWYWYGFCFTGTDPWFFTVDWRWYDFHDEGEFSLFRHKTKPIEVNTIQRRFESHHSWTEHCAIAVRAASDVFIIYGCSRPTKWIVRRLGCQTGSEYLEVYHRWGTYEIVLPTGTRVYVWIAMNRRLNVYISFSRKDRYQTEGLCGTWNMNWDDDFTGRDGEVYDRAYPFARTWSVPASDSLFIAKTRTEKLSQSFMYCTCLGDSGGTLDGLSANVDCSWKESLPVCPPLNFGKQSCSIRSKRSTDGDDDDLTIDISPDILTYTEHPEASSDWKNGWNASSAEDACNNYFKSSVLFDACSSLSNVNVSSAITNCALNIKVSGTDEYMADAFEMFKTECSNEVRTNNTLWTETNDDGNIVAQVVVNELCPFDCTYKGVKRGDCIQGVCSCYTDFAGGDCRVNKTASPQILTNITDESFCDTSKRSCTHISVFGENFYESSNLACLLQKAEVINNVLTANGTSITTTGQMENIGEVKCPVSSFRRRKRSTTNETSIQYYLVSVTNDGATYSDSVPLILYDTSCYTCTTTDSNVNCQLRSDICVVDGICYSSTSSQCSSGESSESKLWIIGIVISVLLVIIIVILLIKWCKSPRHVFPLCGEDNIHDKPSSSELYEAVSRGNTPQPLTRVNL